LLDDAVSAANQSDIIIACVGLDSSLEGEEGDAYNAFASGDKPDLELPDVQKNLLAALHKTGKPLVVAVNCGSALTINWAHENANAVIDAWYPGETGGKAFAQLIFGDYSPSGRLPVTFYKTSEELPEFSDYSMQGRTYRYMENEPLYPFGYGLSYTTFDYSNIIADTSRIKDEEIVTLNFELTNTGCYDGYEKVQVYVSPLNPSVKTPRWQMKAFMAVFFKQGETASVAIKLPLSSFSLVDEYGARFIERGAFKIYVGGNQPDIRSKTLTGKRTESIRFVI